MCGISGFSGDFSEIILKNMVSAISHRGPDDSGTKIFKDSNIGLGHSRLSIIDLSAYAHQPMSNEDDTIWLIFNGEIYNFKELKQPLLKQGHIFKSNSDSEVLIHLYEEYGHEMLTKLNGIFAFAIWDSNKKELFIARDGLGVKPLYIANTPEGILFGSEIKSMLQCPTLSREINLKAVNRYLTFLWCPAPDTMLKAVTKIGPGEACIIKNHQITKQWVWYKLPYDGTRFEKSEHDIATELATKLQECVKRQLVSDVPVGAFLSGGLDSSSLVAMMRKLMPDKPIKCYCIGFEDEEDMEGCPPDFPYAEKVAKHTNIDLEKIVIKPKQLIERLSELIWFLDEPQADPAPINAMFIAEKARKDGIKVLLSGAGGDDIFTGYSRHLALETEKYWSWMPIPIRKLIGSLTKHMGNGKNPWIRRVKKLFANAHLPANERLISYFKWSSSELRRKLFNPKLVDIAMSEPAEKNIVEKLKEIDQEPDYINKMLYLDTKYFLADHNLNYTDKTCMRYGVEARVPLLDPELVAFAAKIPTKMKQKGRIGKAIFKKAMEPDLPNDVIYRKKTPFGAPLRKWIKNDLEDIIANMLSKDQITKRGIFNHHEVTQLIADNKHGKIDGSYTILSILCIEIWCQLFLDGKHYSEIKI